MIIPGVGSPLKILLVVDDSPYSAAAVDLLTHMTWPVGTSTDVLVLVPEHLSQMGPPAETLQMARWRDWTAAKVLATQVANQLQAHHLRVATEIGEGQPAEVALGHTAGRSTDLIVISAKGLSATGEVRLDPAVYKLADRANCSVMMVRPSLQVRPLSTILAVDGSPQTWRTVEFLSAFSLSDWASVTVVSVAEEKVDIPAAMGSINSYLSPGISQVAQPAILGAPESYAAEVCATQVVSRLHEYGVQGWSITPFGHPANEILNAAKQCNAVLIVIGARGQTRPEPFRLGRVAQRVVKEASCSVLVVR
jgi:nucleotide-binding universal stress UspA family protein